jgi:predicted ester cyclase
MQIVSEEGLEVFRNLLRLWDSGDLKGGFSLYSKDADMVWPSARGFEQCEALLHAIYKAFPDGKHEIVESFQAGNSLGFELVFSGTHTGVLTTTTGQEVPPTGKNVTVRIGDIVKVRDKRIVSHHAYWDRMDLFRQLGLMK